MRHKVICIQPLHPEGMKILHSRPDLEIIVPETPDPATWANFLPGTEAICVRLSKIPRSLIEAAPNLKIISRHGVGVDNIDVAAATEHGVIVATVGLANAPSVVEHTLARRPRPHRQPPRQGAQRARHQVPGRRSGLYAGRDRGHGLRARVGLP